MGVQLGYSSVEVTLPLPSVSKSRFAASSYPAQVPDWQPINVLVAVSRPGKALP